MKVKLHWTQDPKNKAKLARVRKLGEKAKRAKQKALAITPRGLAAKAPKQETDTDGTLSLVAAHATGYLSCWLETVSRSHGVSYPALADGVARALRSSARG